MAKIEEKMYSLADAVRDEIRTMPHVRTSLSDGVINYSALARKIMSKVTQKLRRNVNEESVIVSIKRFADEINDEKTDYKYLEIFADSEITLQDNMTFVHFKKTPEVLPKLEKLMSESEWNIGEIRIFVEGGDHAIVVVKQERVEDLVNGMSRDLLHTMVERTLVTLRVPQGAMDTYGIIAEVSKLLAKKGISFELVSTPIYLHFLVSENDAEATYRTFKELVKESKKAVLENTQSIKQ